MSPPLPQSSLPPLPRAYSSPPGIQRYWKEQFFPSRWLDMGKWERWEVFPKVFWKSREEQSGRWAAGMRQVMDLEQVAQVLQEMPPHTRIYGGQAFHSSAGAESAPRLSALAAEGHWGASAWREWPEAFYFLPEWEVCPEPEGTLIRHLITPAKSPAGNLEPCGFEYFQEEQNDHLQPESDTLAEVAQHLLSSHTVASGVSGRGTYSEHPSSAIRRQDIPDYRGWAALVHSVLAQLGQTELEKVVLVRASRLELSAVPEPFRLLEELAAWHPGCAHFCLQPSRTAGAFLGATPERLFRRLHREIETEAVAGTRARSLAPEEDARLEKQLIESLKERSEHAIVVQAVGEVMQQVCEPGWQVSSPGVLKLSRLQHLRSVFSGALFPGMGDAQLIRHLHPTPATGGYPGALAQVFLRQAESFDRGWFAGPVGCFERDRAEVLVAIRSLRVWSGQAEVYAGAGIVEGSDPEREWMELDEKAAGALALFSA